MNKLAGDDLRKLDRPASTIVHHITRVVLDSQRVSRRRKIDDFIQVQRQRVIAAAGDVDYFESLNALLGICVRSSTWPLQVSRSVSLPPPASPPIKPAKMASRFAKF
ncbi:MAG: hypothetical protein H6823_24605, partial [Planctomycetaceae bacterium]|nr:hypothetical protein [Planctomycetaceae bacterium]